MSHLENGPPPLKYNDLIFLMERRSGRERKYIYPNRCGLRFEASIWPVRVLEKCDTAVTCDMKLAVSDVVIVAHKVGVRSLTRKVVVLEYMHKS